MKKTVLLNLLFLACLLKAEANPLTSSSPESLKTAPQVESIQKIAESQRRSLNVTWTQRQKAVNKGMGKNFDSTFEEAHILLDSLFKEIHTFVELQNTISPQDHSSDAVLITASEELNRNALKKLAYFQTLMEYLQAAINEFNSKNSPFKPSVATQQQRLSTSVIQNKRPRKTSIKKRQLLNDEYKDHSGFIKYHISGTSILPSAPEDESFIH